MMAAKMVVLSLPHRYFPCREKNTLRIIDATNNQLPQDRETLFWMNVKAIPSMDKSKLDNTLQLAIISRIKLYYRPANWRSAGSGCGKINISS
jgi:P pilus assembly chaperone PapD